MNAGTVRRRWHLLRAVETVGVLVGVLAVAALGLRILSFVPSALSQEPMQRYATVEEARRSTGVPIHLPAYFPEYLQWPPPGVTAWREPERGIVIAVPWRDSDEVVLWVEEWVSGRLLLSEVPQPGEVVHEAAVPLRGGVEGRLEEFLSRGGQLYRRVSWQEPTIQIVLTATMPREELLRMARTMYPPTSY